VKFKECDGTQLFILSEYDSILEHIEDDLTNLDIFQSGSSTYAYEDQLDHWMKKLSLMQLTVEKVLEAQKLWLLLEPTFQNKSI
jgi:hypothetical protein